MLPVMLHSVKTGGEETAQQVKAKLEVSKVSSVVRGRRKRKQDRELTVSMGKKDSWGKTERGN